MTEFQTQLNSTNQLATSIQDARRAKNMTQTELSTITGIPRPWINQLEHGHIENPGFTKLLKIMDALEMRISVSYAIHESTQDSPEEKTPPTPTVTALADAYANLAKNIEHSSQASSMIPSVSTVIQQWKTIEQSNLTEVSKHLGGLLKNFGQNYADTYTALQNRSKLIEQQAKELDQHEPNTNEEV